MRERTHTKGGPNSDNLFYLFHKKAEKIFRFSTRCDKIILKSEAAKDKGGGRTMERHPFKLWNRYNLISKLALLCAPTLLGVIGFAVDGSLKPSDALYTYVCTCWAISPRPRTFGWSWPGGLRRWPRSARWCCCSPRSRYGFGTGCAICAATAWRSMVRRRNGRSFWRNWAGPVLRVSPNL